MSEASLFDLFRSRWLEIARQFWPETPREQLQSELASLDAELARRQSRLLFRRRRIEKLHDGLKRRERRLALRVASLQNVPADADAMTELERRRLGIKRLSECLQELEYSYAQRLARLWQRKQKRIELRERLLCGSLPKATADESDPDYLF